jgi:hypothetical protein
MRCTCTSGAHTRFVNDVFSTDLDAGSYDDRFGCVALVFSLFVAVCVNFYMTFRKV